MSIARHNAKPLQDLGKETMEMNLQEIVVLLQLLNCRVQGILPLYPVGDPAECPIDLFDMPVAAEPVLANHLLDDQWYRVRDLDVVLCQVLINSTDELVQFYGAVSVPADRKEMVVEDIDDNAGIAPSRAAHEPPAGGKDLVRIRE
jgi:hypothetical protein